MHTGLVYSVHNAVHCGRINTISPVT